ncbi:MAG: FAD-dependent monooxygenase [Gammaproteobacteria bacterium]|nr:FAD-dependent monooxygenase [Gammaproteobacteria bacterium]
MGTGPAGATLALLLAQRGIEVSLLERRRDFAREFRGEVLMPSGREALEQMGLGALLSEVPTYAAQEFAVFLDCKVVLGGPLNAEDFGGRPPLAVSQPAFLQGVIDIGRQISGFEFLSGIAVKSLVRDGPRIAGVVVRDPLAGGGERTLAADLVVGADGRNSIVRRQMGLAARSMSPPMDVVWCKLPCPKGWTGLRAFAGRGHLLIGYRTWDDALQLGWVIAKGTFGALRSKGIRDWIDTMANHVPPDLASHLRRHREGITRPFLLDVVSDRVDSWYRPGALVIGDAAHAMSPVGGQGINIALRDAIVAANHLVPALSDRSQDGEVDNALGRVEAERLPEVARIQRLQALPPTVVMSRAKYGSLVRRTAALATNVGLVRRVLASAASDFLYGVTKVSLRA